jgi:hypothetical protein
MDLILGLALSTHLGLSQSYNEIHPHIRISNDKYIAGAYYNSVENLSIYSGIKYSYGDIAIEGGLATGYSPHPITPYGRVTYDYVDNIKLFGTTAYESNGKEVRGGIVLGIEFILNP